MRNVLCPPGAGFIYETYSGVEYQPETIFQRCSKNVIPINCSEEKLEIVNSESIENHVLPTLLSRAFIQRFSGQYTRATRTALCVRHFPDQRGSIIYLCREFVLCKTCQWFDQRIGSGGGQPFTVATTRRIRSMSSV